MLPNLKILRQEYGISQQRLADAIGVSQQAINQYENHSVEPDISILTRLADHFNTSIDFVVGRTDRLETTIDLCGTSSHFSEQQTHPWRSQE